MEVICLEDTAFYTLVEQVVARLKDSLNIKSDEWLSDEQAMQILKIKSKTTLQKLRCEVEIRFSQPKKKVILYDRNSIEAYVDKHARNAF